MPDYKTKITDNESKYCIAKYKKEMRSRAESDTSRRAGHWPVKPQQRLALFSNSNVAFNLFHKPKEIIQTTPWKIQEPYEKAPDSGREDAIRTRPRLVMPPAIAMDDIENPRAREILLDNMYTSVTARETRGLLTECFNVKAPFLGYNAPPNPVTLPKLQPPYVSPEWRKESLSSNNNQLRYAYDSTKGFWLGQR